MNTVGFTAMKDGTREEYLMLRELERPFLNKTADRVLQHLALQSEDTLSGYRVTRLEHALQSATRALRDDADVDWVVAALLHDIGDGLAPQNHDRFAAEILRPYVREEVTWVVEHHGAFQMYYYAHHFGWDRHLRDQYADHIYYRSCERFCAHWDQNSFDPDFPHETLAYFEPMVREVFARKAFDPQVLQSGVVRGVPTQTTTAQGASA